MLGVLIWAAWSSPSGAQVRTADQVFSDIDLLFEILQAVVMRVDVDDPDVLAANFPGRTFADFDRDRNGHFMRPLAGMGLFDLQLAIVQFNHDQFDADGDGLSGFVELECRFLPPGIPLDPADPETIDGEPDGLVDCDGDGLSNLEEIFGGGDALDIEDQPGPQLELERSSVNWIGPTRAAAGDLVLELRGTQTMRFEGEGLTLEGEIKP
jgi:hypothetical protein